MSEKILEGMARSLWKRLIKNDPYRIPVDDEADIVTEDELEAMRAALLWLADNVTDEMVEELSKALDIAAQYEIKPQRKYALAAALRKAAGATQ